MIVKGIDCFDALPDIIESVMRIASDKQVFEAYNNTDDKIEAFSSVARKLCAEHKDDCVRLLAALNGVTVDEYIESLDTPFKLVKDVISMLQTEIVKDFL